MALRRHLDGQGELSGADRRQSLRGERDGSGAQRFESHLQGVDRVPLRVQPADDPGVLEHEAQPQQQSEGEEGERDQRLDQREAAPGAPGSLLPLRGLLPHEQILLNAVPEQE